MESQADETLAYGYQTFGDRRIFTKFSAGHSGALERLLEDYDEGGPLPCPISLTAEYDVGASNPYRFRFELADESA